MHDDYSIVWGRGPAYRRRAGGGARNSPASAKILCLLRFRGHATQLRRRLPPLPLALITAFAVFPLPEEQPVHHAPGPCPHPVPRPTVTTAAQCFVGPATKKRIEELVDGDQRSLSVGHAAATDTTGAGRSSKLISIAATASGVCAALMESRNSHFRA